MKYEKYVVADCHWDVLKFTAVAYVGSWQGVEYYESKSGSKSLVLHTGQYEKANLSKDDHDKCHLDTI